MITDIVFSMIFILIEIIILFTIINRMLDLPGENILRQILFSIPLSLLCSLILNITKVQYSYLINLICLFFLIYILCKESFINTLIIYFFTYSLAAILQCFVFPIIILFNVDTSSYFGLLFVNLCSLTITFTICHFIPLSRIYSYLITKDSLLKIIIINSFIIIMGIILYYKIDSSVFIQSFIYIGICIILLIFVNSEIFKSKYKYQKQQLQLKAYIEYSPIIDDLISQIREKQHDYNNHIQSMQMLPLTHTDYESLSTELLRHTKYMVDSNYSSELLKLNLKLVCGFLISKCSEATSKGKELKIDISSYTLHTIVPEYELIDIIGILIDNCIEAIDIGGTSTLSISSSANKINIKTVNIGPVVNENLSSSIFKNGYSTKTSHANNRGLGLYKLKKMINSYGGSIVLSNEFDTVNTFLVFEISV